jgi:hypothetical protein
MAKQLTLILFLVAIISCFINVSIIAIFFNAPSAMAFGFAVGFPLVQTVLASGIYLNLFKAVRNNHVFSALSFFLLPLILLCFFFREDFDADTLPLLSINIPFFMLLLLGFLWFRKKINNLSIKKTAITLGILALISFLVIALSNGTLPKYNVLEIERGVWLERANNSSTAQYFSAFSVAPKSDKKYWKVLYKNTAYIYFGFVERKNIFSQTEVVNMLSFHKVALDSMKKDIPFYETEDMEGLLTHKIEEYLRIEGGGGGIDIISGKTIFRNKEIQYQLEVIEYGHHFEMGILKNKKLIIMDKNLNVLDMFYLSD